MRLANCCYYCEYLCGFYFLVYFFMSDFELSNIDGGRSCDKSVCNDMFDNSNKTVAIVGAGAAGLMAAASVLEFCDDVNVVLIEKNSVFGRKVMLSGGGRCNLTSGISDLSIVLKKYPRGAKFLRFAMHEFSPNYVFKWFEKAGVPLKIEKDMRVFPQSNKGDDVVNVFKEIFEKYSDRVLVMFNTKTEKIEHFLCKNNGLKSGKFKVLTSQKVFSTDAVILATGGQAYRFTGSEGDGYSFAESFGHSVSDLGASLNSFICFEKWIGDLAGVSVSDAVLKIKSLKKTYSRGAFLFTHQGITGPAVFALSSLVAFEKYDEENPLKIFVDFLPEMNEDVLRDLLWNLLQKNMQKEVFNVLKGFSSSIPKSLLSLLLKLLNADIHTKSAEISKKVVNKLVILLKDFELNAVARGKGSEFVTAGGVNLKEVNPNTMESKMRNGLYFAGELLNIDAFTGGFNLQAAWATGRCAGSSVSKRYSKDV